MNPLEYISRILAIKKAEKERKDEQAYKMSCTFNPDLTNSSRQAFQEELDYEDQCMYSHMLNG